MDPITIVFLIVAGAAAAGLTWEKLTAWIDARKVPAGTATILRKRLATGQYQLVTGVFSPTGSKLAEKTWITKRLAPDLERHFGAKDLIRIET